MDSLSPKTFEQLKTSTKTIMVYTNMDFNLIDLFYVLPISPVKIPWAKKVKKTDIHAPFGGIFSVQKRTETRGVDTRPVVKKKKTNTAMKRKKNIEHFLNQVSILLSLGDHHIHMMLFGDNIKIAGCKTNEDAILTIRILYMKYLKPLSETPNGKTYFTLKSGHDLPLFIFDTVMRNVDFSLNFDINREKVNDVFNSVEHNDKVFMSQFETTEQKSVNMKKYAIRPKDFSYICFSPEEDSITRRTTLFGKENDYQMYNSFLIFSSSKVILSGKYDDDMRDSYNFFVKTMIENRRNIEEIIDVISDEEKQNFRNILHS